MSTKKKGETLNLLRNKHGEHFPKDREDYELMRSRFCLNFRIPESALPVFSHTIFKDLNLNIEPLGEHLRNVIGSAVESLSNAEGVSVKSEGASIKVGYYLEQYGERFNSFVQNLSMFLGRHGLKLTRDNVNKGDDAVITTLTVVEDRELNPSYSFGDFDTEVHMKETTIHLSSYARLVLRRHKAPNTNTPLVSMIFEDLIGTTWEQAFIRTFDLRRLDIQELGQFASALLLMIPTPKAKSNGN